jgi:hypothetical protein
LATVTYSKCWLTNVATTEQLSAQTAPDRKRSFAAAGGDPQRVYGSGRIRSVRQAGVKGTWTFELMELTLAQVNTLTVWLSAGATLFVRDHRGLAAYGTFFGVDISENVAVTPTYATYRASITLNVVDVIEGV